MDFLEITVFNVLFFPVNNCSTPEPPNFGKVTDGNVHYLATRNFSCNKGYNLNGSPTRICQEDGSWSGQKASCESKIKMKEHVFVLYIQTHSTG